ncbi:DUF4271 domain-containing protein [Emticicia sp. C21]|uniref:DUF4271 domain-containing protein n=1 Tax=Emticicia sp. C21 TaxID=2302915 RepID=UPI000E352588|nr:DUF4271 domain-containing protein [Emticicia sp. C21]RFS17507.1 DUF4271 domain-containing protein [Emticicia sp. C21]
MKKGLYILFLLISFHSFAGTVGPNGGYYLVHDYHDDWQVYSDRMKAYVPYIAEQHVNYPSHTVFCDIESNRGYSLLVHAQKEDNFLFINGSLRQKIPSNQWIVLNIDSLYKVYEQPQIYITLYGSPNIEDKKLYLGHKRQLNQKPIVLAESSIKAQPRTPTPYKNYFVLVSMFILVVFTYLSNSYVRAFERYYNLRDLFNTLVRDQSFLINKPLSRMNIMFIVMLAMIMSFFCMLLQSKGIYVFGARTFLQEGETLGVLASNYFRICLAVFMALIFKYFFISLIGQLFNLEKVVDLHYFKIIQSSIIFYTFLVLALLVLFLEYFPVDFNWTAYLFTPIILFYLIRFLILYFTINRSVPIQSLYLISYLCIVELLPIILGIRFAI